MRDPADAGDKRGSAVSEAAPLLPTSGPAASPVLAVVIPTFNERKNVAALAEALGKTLCAVRYEIIFVDDDSPDGTAAAVRELTRRDARIRVLQRIGRRGLASACLEGMLASSAPYLAVMDADLQHDESILPRMLEAAEAPGVEVVIASRHVEGGSLGDFEESRVLLSNFGKTLSRLVCRTPVSDPMSGFFLITREFLEEVVHRTSGVGFKILLDLLSSAHRPVRCVEVPYTFRNRLYGESKLALNVKLEYIYLLLDKAMGDYIPLRFVLFGLVGALGLVLNTAVVGVLFLSGWVAFLPAQAIATVLAMTLNFFLNNLVTYRDARLRGLRLVGGLITFYLACGVGAVSNIATAQFLLQRGVPWFAASAFGLTISAVWNYGVTATLTWRVRRRSLRIAESRAKSGSKQG